MQTNAEKCREMQKNAEKCRKMQRNAVKCREIQRHVDCREMQRNSEQFKEMQNNAEKCRYISHLPRTLSVSWSKYAHTSRINCREQSFYMIEQSSSSLLLLLLLLSLLSFASSTASLYLKQKSEVVIRKHWQFGSVDEEKRFDNWTYKLRRASYFSRSLCNFSRWWALDSWRKLHWRLILPGLE